MTEAPPWAVTLLHELRQLRAEVAALRPAPAPAELDPEDDVTAAEARLLRRAQHLGLVVSGDGRVGASSAAVLLEIAEGTLANMRSADTGPSWNRRRVGGHRVSYSIQDWLLGSWQGKKNFKPNFIGHHPTPSAAGASRPKWCGSRIPWTNLMQLKRQSAAILATSLLWLNCF